jgi:hypothetical protein
MQFGQDVQVFCIDYFMPSCLEKLILGSKRQVFFGIYLESTWMWRHFGDMNLLRNNDVPRASRYATA